MVAYVKELHSKCWNRANLHLRNIFSRVTKSKLQYAVGFNRHGKCLQLINKNYLGYRCILNNTNKDWDYSILYLNIKTSRDK